MFGPLSYLLVELRQVRLGSLLDRHDECWYCLLFGFGGGVGVSGVVLVWVGRGCWRCGLLEGSRKKSGVGLCVEGSVRASF